MNRDKLLKDRVEQFGKGGNWYLKKQFNQKGLKQN